MVLYLTRKSLFQFSAEEVSVYSMFLMIHRMKIDRFLNDHKVTGNPITQNTVAVYCKNNCILLEIIQINIQKLRGQNAELLNIAACGEYIYIYIYIYIYNFQYLTLVRPG